MLFLIALLIFAITWFYHYFRNHFGSDIALVALAIILTVELILILCGAVYTSHIHRAIRKRVDATNDLSVSTEDEKSMMFKVFDMDLKPYAIVAPVETKMDSVQQEIQKLLTCPPKRRGKQPRFPMKQIQKAVLQWEKRDPSFSTETLEEFLGREFGSGPDGILLMSVSTFYDWRRRILKELEDHRPPESKAAHSTDHPLSQLPSRTTESTS